MPKHARKKKVSFFELVASLAFDHFARRQVDVAVIETGLGGRLDATNVLTPELTIITDINYDHTEILGDTIEEIAGEKAGIIKPRVPNLVGLLRPDAMAVMREVCRERQAPLIRLRKRDFTIDNKHLRLDFSSNGLSMAKFRPGLLGTHQLRNTALVLKAVEMLKGRGFRLPRSAVQRGLKDTQWQGRFQILANGSGPEVILDVCHNASGARAFAETFSALYPDKRCLMVIGFVKRKQHQEMIDAFGTITRHFQVVPLNTKRSVSVKDLVKQLDWRGVSVDHSARLETGWRKVLKSASNDDTICVIGSHYLVGEFLKVNGYGH
ncbi:hypothetical protein GF377_10975 [candidate division GN15 bacterium]|nr:hypothetical protein [candidate division GN15 bacterium]